MKAIKAISLLLTVPLMLSACSTAAGSDNTDDGLIHGEDFRKPYITNIYDICSSDDDESHYYDIVSGAHLNVTCEIDPNLPEDTDITMYIFKENNEYIWDPDDAVECVTGTSATVPLMNPNIDYPIGEAPALKFSCDVPAGLESGEYVLVFTYDDNEVDTIETVHIVASADETFKVVPEVTYPEGVRKPVIYLYPEEETEVDVSLDFTGEITCTYPAYNDGWNVIAAPDGRLFDTATGRYYDYLFWEGDTELTDPFSNAICVKGCDTEEFLEEYLDAAGLSSSEIDDFITYWLPKMQDNEYNLISFPTEEYEELAGLNVSPSPDTVIRIYMVFTPLNEEAEIPEERALVMPHGVERTGFTVVEWGGSEI